jgi:hypothetical protein
MRTFGITHLPDIRQLAIGSFRICPDRGVFGKRVGTDPNIRVVSKPTVDVPLTLRLRIADGARRAFIKNYARAAGYNHSSLTLAAVAAYREALKEQTPQTDPTNYQLTMKNLNQVLTLLKKSGKKASVH